MNRGRNEAAASITSALIRATPQNPVPASGGIFPAIWATCWPIFATLARHGIRVSADAAAIERRMTAEGMNHPLIPGLTRRLVTRAEACRRISDRRRRHPKPVRHPSRREDCGWLPPQVPALARWRAHAASHP